MLLPHSDPPQTPAAAAGATAFFSGKYGCGPAFYHSDDILFFFIFTTVAQNMLDAIPV